MPGRWHNQLTSCCARMSIWIWMPTTLSDLEIIEEIWDTTWALCELASQWGSGTYKTVVLSTSSHCTCFIPIQHTTLSYLSHCCEKIPWEKQFKRGRICSGSQFEHIQSLMGKTWQQEFRGGSWPLAPTVRKQNEQEMELGYQRGWLPISNPLPPARLYLLRLSNLFIHMQYHQLWTKCSNTWADGGQFTLKPPPSSTLYLNASDDRWDPSLCEGKAWKLNK